MSDSEIVVGIDVGTSAVKALAINRSGKEVFSSSKEIYTDSVRSGWNEQEPLHWWNASCQVLQEITSYLDARNIKALGLSGQMHSPAFLDKNDNIIRPSMLWSDGRTSSQCADIYESLGGDRVKNIIGNPILEGFTAPKLLWLKQHEGSNFKKLDSFLIAKDYIGFLLTGEKVTEPSDASGTVLMDLYSCDWSKEVLTFLDLQNVELPEIRRSTDVVGGVTRHASKATGLLEGTPVVAGGADNAAAAISTNSMREDVCQISLGTSGTVLQTTMRPVVDDGLRLHSFSHCLPNSWYSMGVTLNAGASFAWFANNVIDMPNRYGILDDEASIVDPGCDGLVFLPYLNGERTPHNDPNIRGAFLRLDASHSRGHMIRSIMEGVAFSIKEVYELMGSLINPADTVVVTGGGANSKVWSQILADVLGKNLSKVVTQSGPSHGAALLSAVGIGWFNSIHAAVERWVLLSDHISFNRDHMESYQESYFYYQRAYSKVKSI